MSDEKSNIIRPRFNWHEQAHDPHPCPRATEKLALFTDLVARAMVMVTIDTRREGVRVPRHYVGNPQLNLNFSTRFGLEDFAYDIEGVRATLSFQGQASWCVVPWSSVYMMRFTEREGSVAIFAEDFPPELKVLIPDLERFTSEAIEGRQRLLEAFAQPAPSEPASGVDWPSPAAKPVLRLVSGGRCEENTAPSTRGDLG